MGRLASRRCVLFIACDASRIPRRYHHIVLGTPSRTAG